MMLKNCCPLVLLLCLGWAGQGRAQPCVSTPAPTCTFEALDDNGVAVQSFCVGKRVKFQPCASRNPSIFLNPIRYGVMRGVGATFFNTTPPCTPDQLYPYYYTPTLAQVGTVTVSELTNENGRGYYYIREFQVHDSTPPSFTITPCSSGTAQVRVTDPKFNSYDVQVVPAGIVTPSTLTYNQLTVLTFPAGTTAITVTGHYAAPDACDGVNTQAIPALSAPVPPLLTSLTLAGPAPGGAATLAVGGLTAGYRYAIQVDDGGGFHDVLAVLPGSSSPVSLPASVKGCYRLYREDVCGGSQASSLPICTLSLSGRSASNRNQLVLDDAGASPGNTYTVTRNGQPLTTFTTNAGVLEDADVQCGSTYTYVVSRQQGGGVSVSNPVSITTMSSLPPPQPRLLASFNPRNVVELTPLLATPTLAAGSSLRYTRSAGGRNTIFGPFTTLRGLRDSVSVDTLRRNPPCYTVRLSDVCTNPSPESVPACPSLLTALPAGPDGMAASLSWTAFGGPDPSQPATYVVQRLAPDGSVLSAQPVSGLTYADLQPPTDFQTLRYRLQIGGAGLPAGVFSYSNTDGFIRPLGLAVPSAFTPNGDGLNDVLEVKGRFLRDYTFVVVDRNGQEVFRGSRRTDVWDGRIGSHAPVLGTYAWRFQQTTEEGKTFSATGVVTILK